jgi:hypothetical protein
MGAQVSVSCDSSDGTCDVWKESVRRAAKDRKCDACIELIRKGDRYHVTRSLYDGEWETTSRCARCQAMFAFLSGALPSGEVCHGELDCGHTWEENFKRQLPPEVASLAFLTGADAQSLLEKGMQELLVSAGAALRLQSAFWKKSHNWFRQTPEIRRRHRFYGRLG